MISHEEAVKRRREALRWLCEAGNGRGHPEDCMCDKCIEAREILVAPIGDAPGAPKEATE